MYRQRFHSILLCLLVVGIGLHLGSDNAKAEKTLRWKLKKGDAFDVEMIQDVNQQMNVQGNDVNITQKMSMYVTWAVVEIGDDSIIQMTQTIDRIVMDMTVPNVGDVKIDTNSKEEPQGIGKMMMDMMKPMVNVKMIQKMNDRGEVLDVEIPEQALAGLNANPMMKQFFSGDAFKEMMKKASPALPEEPVTPGYAWSKKSTVKSPVGDMQMSNTFKYEGEVEKEGKKLEKITADVEMEFLGGADNQLGADIKVTEQDNKGAMFFDAEAGRFVESNLEQKMTMKVDVAGQSITQKITNKTVMKIKPKKAE